MERGPDGVWVWRFAAVTGEFSYRALAGGVASAWYRVRVADAPAAGNFEMRYTYPAYSGLACAERRRRRRDRGPQGDLGRDHLLDQRRGGEGGAGLREKPGRGAPARASGDTAPSCISTGRPPTGSSLKTPAGSPTAAARSTPCATSRTPPPPSRSPSPRAKSRATRAARSPCATAAPTTTGSRGSLSWPVPRPASAAGRCRWPPGPAAPGASTTGTSRRSAREPGEVVSGFVEAADNDTISGPKVGASAVVRVRIADPREKREQTREAMEKLAEDLLQLLGEELDLQARYQELEEQAGDWETIPLEGGGGGRGPADSRRGSRPPAPRSAPPASRRRWIAIRERGRSRSSRPR